MALEILILAAGQGKRMRSGLPKVLHPLAGRPLLAHVLDTARALEPARVIVVHGHGAEQVKQAFPARGLHWVLQAEQLGTAHAVMQAMRELIDCGAVERVGHLEIRIANRRRFQKFIDGDRPQPAHGRTTGSRSARPE